MAVQNKLNLSSNSGRFFLYLNCKDCQSFFFFFFLMCKVSTRSVFCPAELLVQSFVCCSYLALYFLTELIFLFNSCVSSCHLISS